MKTNASICLGTMQFGWLINEKESIELLEEFFQLGGTFIDTANIYSGWSSRCASGTAETIIGRWMKDVDRKDIRLATKVRERMWEGEDGEGLSKKHITRACEDSLNRLQTNYIDLYYAHREDDKTPILETIEAFNLLMERGYIRAYGLSNFPLESLIECVQIALQHGYTLPKAVQLPYSLVVQDQLTSEVIKSCRSNDIEIVTYSPLAEGFLSGQYIKGESPKKSSRSTRVMEKFDEEDCWGIAEVVSKLAKENNLTMSHVAHYWVLHSTNVDTMIIGPKNKKHVRQVFEALNMQISLDPLNRFVKGR